MRGKMMGVLILLLSALLGTTLMKVEAASLSLNPGATPSLSAAAALSIIAKPMLALASLEQGTQPSEKKVEVDINVNRGGGGARWYVNPIWVAMGGVGLVLIILLIVLAARGGGGPIIISK